jgi:hypothetical protein
MPPKGKSGLSRSSDDYAVHRCQCHHLVYEDDVPGGKCRFCPCTDHRRPVRAPARCPGHTCDLGRTQDWIKGQGKIDGQHSDLPPGHFWYTEGSYLAHAEVLAS